MLFKDQQDIKQFSEINCVCCEKTGVLTRLGMNISKVYTDGKVFNVPEEKDLLQQEQQAWKMTQVNAIFNSSVVEQNAKYNQYDIAKFDFFQQDQVQRIVSEYKIVNIPNGEMSEIQQSSSSKFHFKVIQDSSNKDFILLIQAIEVGTNFDQYWKQGEIEKITENQVNDLLTQTKELNAQGGRVLFYGYKIFAKEQWNNFTVENLEDQIKKGALKFILSGYIYYQNVPLPGLKEIIKEFRDNNIKLVLMTGDHTLESQKFAKEMEILQDKSNLELLAEKQFTLQEAETVENLCIQESSNLVIEGKKLDQIIKQKKEMDQKKEAEDQAKKQEKEQKEQKEDQEPQEQTGIIDKLFEKQNIIFTRMSPELKAVVIEQFQKLKYNVAVVGNFQADLPALRISDFGVALLHSTKMVIDDSRLQAMDFTSFAQNLLTVKRKLNRSIICWILQFMDTPLWFFKVLISLGSYIGLAIYTYQQGKALYSYWQ